MAPETLSYWLLQAAWITGNTAAVYALMGFFARRNPEWTLFGLVILTLALLANAGIVAFFI